MNQYNIILNQLTIKKKLCIDIKQFSMDTYFSTPLYIYHEDAYNYLSLLHSMPHRFQVCFAKLSLIYSFRKVHDKK